MFSMFKSLVVAVVVCVCVGAVATSAKAGDPFGGLFGKGGISLPKFDKPTFPSLPHTPMPNFQVPQFPKFNPLPFRPMPAFPRIPNFGRPQFVMPSLGAKPSWGPGQYQKDMAAGIFEHSRNGVLIGGLYGGAIGAGYGAWYTDHQHRRSKR